MPSPTSRIAAALLLAGLVVTTARADEWDVATDPDNGSSTDNVLFHGSVQRHDLGTQIGPTVDQDWFLMELRPFSSYEVAVDGQGGDLGLGPSQVERLDAQGTVVQTGTGAESPGTVTLKFRNLDSAETGFVRVRNPACSTLCDLNDRYTIRFHDTTYTVPRFNNSGSQFTVLIVQNATAHACEIAPTYFDGAGDSIVTIPAALPGNAHLVIPTASVAGLAGQSGSIRIAHTCGYDGLSGKAVSIEPATGFTFDTMLVPRPH